MKNIRGTKFNWIQIVMALTVMLMGSTSSAGDTYSTGDGLRINVDSTGRTDSLFLVGHSILFSDDETGGFYIRDNTIQSGTTLPNGVSNLLQCPGFQESGVECLTSYWTRTVPSGLSQISAEEPVPDSSDFAAKIVIDEDPTTGSASWAILSQVVDLGTTTTNDLYYLIFEVATESGWRPYNHPDGWDDRHGDHKIYARVEWFGADPPTLPTPLPAHSPQALAVSTIDAYETTVFDLEEPETDGMIRFCLRTHRPFQPTEATRARISLVVKGFLPDDGTGEDPNHVWFDNVYFFKAPAEVELTGYGAGTGNFLALPGLEDLSMWVDITEVNEPGGAHYIRFDGAVRNDDTESAHNPRAIDLGFALPILDHAGNQDVTWWDDARNANEISVADAEAQMTSWVPYRLTGPIDQRASTDLWMRADPAGELKKFNARADNNQISAYPFSVVDVEKGSGGRYGISFGEHLGYPVAPADPQVAHFGYHIEQPNVGLTPFIGKYYVEFNLGLLKPTVGDTVTPFSFILFRSDDPAHHETSRFREGAEKYQTTFFPFAFTRPTHLPPEDEWLFGGGQFKPERNEDSYPEGWWETGFTENPNDFGLRYAANVLSEVWTPLYLEYGRTNNVRILLYDRPWTAEFPNDNTGPTRNTYDNLLDRAENYATGGLPGAIYRAKKEHQLTLPNINGGESNLYGRRILKDPDPVLHEYVFPVLLADFNNPTDSIIDAETNYYNTAYSGASAGDTNPEGLAGLEYDLVFDNMTNGNHIDQTESRMADYRASGGAPTYSFNSFMPAIPQLIPNCRFLDLANALLASIDANNVPGFNVNYGEGSDESSNTTEELLIGNIIQTDYGGTKYAMMKADVAGYESSAVTAFNSSEESLAFRRTMMRDKSTARHLVEFPCLVVEEDKGILPEFDDLGLDALFIDEDQLRIQLVNEVSWISLTWGFLPAISKYLPLWPTEGDYYDFVDTSLRPLFNFKVPNNPRRGYTHIFQELHLAGWEPVTNVEIDVHAIIPHLDELYWERFGGGGEPGFSNPTYVTVLNNKELQFTIIELFESQATGLIPLREIEDEQQLIDIGLCFDLFTPSNAPPSCDAVNFRARDKDIKVRILDPIEMGLWANNIHGVQLVGYTPPSPPAGIICNAPLIEAKSIDEGYTSLNEPFSIHRGISSDGPIVRIGGRWFLGEQQKNFEIPDKALMVFKLWSTNIAGNGVSGGDGDGEESTTGGQEDDEPLISAYYERYGQGWTRTASLDGHEGSVDAVSADSPGAAAYFKVHAARSGHHQVQIQFPPTEQATGAALYEVYLTDYLIDPAGSSSLGEPLFSAVVDQSDSASYDSARDPEGFVTIGDLEISLEEGREVATVVVKLSSPDNENDSQGGSSALLLADAVRLARIE